MFPPLPPPPGFDYLFIVKIPSEKLRISKPVLYFFSIAFFIIGAAVMTYLCFRGSFSLWNTLFIVLPLLGAFTLMTFYFTDARTFHHRLENMKGQLERQQILTKRKTRLAAYFNRVLKDAADIIFTLDIDGYVLKFNTGAESILGFLQHEIVGRPFTDLLLNPADAALIFDAVLKSDRVQNHEIRMKAKNGTEIMVSMSISEMRDERSQILGMVATCKDITENKRLEKELIEKNALLEALAITDNLSGLYNVRHFHSEMTQAFTRLRRSLYSSLTLLLIDIDHFKELNDTAGHQAGDTVIEFVGQAVKLSIRKDLDSAYRYGGDEFVVLLLEADAASGTVVAERILKRFREKKYGRTSLSIGIATADKEDDEEKLVHRADAAMYEAKRNGGDRVTIFTS
ncbi:MAG: GGDEF domain-containing protein [Fibrobacterota bacterium]